MNIKNKKFIILLLTLCLLSFVLIGCTNNETAPKTPLTKSNYMLGTYITISLYDNQDNKIIDEAFERIRDVENKMSINTEEPSQITRLNEASGSNSVELTEDTFHVLERGLYYSKLSGGKFDITIGPIVKLWNIGTEYAAVPDNEILKEKLKLVDYNKLSLNRENLTAKLEMEGMIVDLGAIAKGYAADEVASILRKNGVKHAIINLGGNILVIGSNINGAPWKIGIQDPYDTRNEYLGIVEVVDKTVVTSGIYERYLEVDGKRYHHILDPATGYPADNGLASVSIITSKSIDGDGLSTSTFLLGLEKGLELIENTEDAEAIFVTTDKKIYLTSGIKNIFTLTNKEYTVMD